MQGSEQFNRRRIFRTKFFYIIERNRLFFIGKNFYNRVGERNRVLGTSARFKYYLTRLKRKKIRSKGI